MSQNLLIFTSYIRGEPNSQRRNRHSDLANRRRDTKCDVINDSAEMSDFFVSFILLGCMRVVYTNSSVSISVR